MKILHTADLHLGQVLYQNYDRTDEHDHFFKQLEEWCVQENPDALVVSGDIFDIQQPSAATKKRFANYFVSLHQKCPTMRIVIVAGNHDSASRLETEQAVWKFTNTHIVGLSPSTEMTEKQLGWEENYIVRLNSGYIVALPYMIGEKEEQTQALLDKVRDENIEGKPVVMTGHLAVTGVDITGHDFEIGTLKTQEVDSLGKGFDYLALGHIHKPQTIGHQEDNYSESATYESPVVRYSGSPLHVSCDENYPHSVSMVEIDRHGGKVHITLLPIEQLRHFHTLPMNKEASFKDEKEVIEAIRAFAKDHEGYIRLRADYSADFPSNFNQSIYELLEEYDNRIRFNPKIIWTNMPSDEGKEKSRPLFEVSDLQQMSDPIHFIEKTMNQYPEFDLDEIRDAFDEVKAEMLQMQEEEKKKS